MFYPVGELPMVMLNAMNDVLAAGAEPKEVFSYRQDTLAEDDLTSVCGASIRS